MTLLRIAGVCALAVLLAPGVAGCRSTDRCCQVAPSAAPPNQPSAGATQGATLAAAPAGSSGVRSASYRLPAAAQSDASRASDELFAGQAALSLSQLVERVQNRNPSLQAMTAAWQAAAERYPQVTSLDDPMFNSAMAPASFDSNQVTSAYAVQGSQKIPWAGKRAARGRIAQADATAACQDLEDSRIRLAEMTRMAFFDYYLVYRETELNRQNREIIREFRDTASRKYEANLVTQQDLLQVDVELADLDRRQIELERMDRTAVARINTLLSRPADAPLPAPPDTLGAVTEPLPVESLRQTALARRPDLAALASRVQSEQAALTLADREYYPDMEYFGRYDSFWQPSSQRDLRAQVGVNMNVPLYKVRREAGVREAMFRLAQRRAEYNQRVLEIEYEVQSIHAQLEESYRATKLYSARFLPAAQQNVESARTNYDVGRGDFLNLIQAQRQLIMLRERYQQALADYHRRNAELIRVVGGTLSEPGRPEDLPLPGAP